MSKDWILSCVLLQLGLQLVYDSYEKKENNGLYTFYLVI